MLKSLPLGTKLVLRELRSGQAILLLSAVVLATAIVASIGVFAERLSRSIVSESSQLLGGDLVVRARRPISIDFSTLALEKGTDYFESEGIAFSTMLSANDSFQLASIRAVDALFPLRGDLQISDTLFGEVKTVNSGPNSGELWVDPRVLQTLQLNIGEYVTLGATQLQITAILVSEPSSSSNPMGVRALMQIDDIASAQVIVPGSRITYSKYFSAKRENLTAIKTTLQAQQLPEWEILDVKEGRPRVEIAMQRAESYLLLGSTLGVMLAAVALAIAGHRFTLQQLPVVAMLKTLGKSSANISGLLAQQLFTLAILGISVGCIVAYGIQLSIAFIAAQWFDIILEQASITPYLLGALTALLCLLGFILPTLLQLRAVPAAFVLRQETQYQLAPFISTITWGMPLLILLMAIVSNSLWMTLSLVVGLTIMLSIVSLLAWVILLFSKKLLRNTKQAIKLAISSIQRRIWNSIFQISIFAITLSLILVLFLLRTSLINDWSQQIPDKTPNHFLINIQEDQIPKLREWLVERNLQDEGLYPFIPGRITKLNDIPIKTALSDNPEMLARSSRDFIFTFAQDAPSYNPLLAGEWWSKQQKSLVSVEQDIAEDLGLALNDTIDIQLGADKFTATIANIRQVNWEEMKPAFYFIFNPYALSQFDATYMTSIYLPAEQKNQLVSLIKAFPTVSILEIDTIIKQIKSIISKVTIAVEFILYLIIVAGLLVVIASVKASLNERLQESALLRALGAKKQLILRTLSYEFASIGGLAGLLAACIAQIIIAILQLKLFNMTPQLYPWLLIAGPLMGATIITITGIWSSIKVVKIAPNRMLNALQ